MKEKVAPMTGGACYIGSHVAWVLADVGRHLVVSARS
jgi:UDP-glucose 4-epimerase